MSNTTKQDLIASVAQYTGLTQSDTRIVVEELLDDIAGALAQEGTIEIRGFGTFYTRVRKPRPARNPKTGEVVPLLRRVVPLFKYSGELRKRICAKTKQKFIGEEVAV